MKPAPLITYSFLTTAGSGSPVFKPAGEIIQFEAINAGLISDSDLMMLGQMNILPPASVLGEVARRGLQKEFSRLWKEGLAVPNN